MNKERQLTIALLTEKLQKLTGKKVVLKEIHATELTEVEMQEIVDDIVAKANGDKSAEYDFAYEVAQSYDQSEDIIKEISIYARSMNYHSIADAFSDYLKNITTQTESEDDEPYERFGSSGREFI